jgi:hypothetical protein
LGVAILLSGGAISAGAAENQAAAAMRPHLSAPTGTVHLVDYSTNDGPDSTVILTGAVGDEGRAESVYPNGSIDPEHDADLRLILKGGSFVISVAKLDARLVRMLRTATFSPISCSGRANVVAKASVIPGSGTGLYRGLSGTFNMSASLDEVVASSSCTFSGPTIAQLVLIQGVGTLSK